MPWSLKALDEKLPCPLAGFSSEMLEAIVRAAVFKGDVIDLGEMHQEIEALTKAFASFPLLMQVAEREVMRVNTFILPEWFTDNSRRYEFVEENEEKREIHTRRWFDRTATMLRDGRNVEHLDICPVNDLAGGSFDLDACRLELTSPPLDIWTRCYFGQLHRRFPNLKILNIIVKTCQCKNVDANFWMIKDEDAHTDNQFMTLFKCDIFLRVQDFLAFAGNFHLPGLKRKTLTFLQWDGEAECSVMDGTPYHVPPKGKSCPVQHPGDAEQGRFVFLLAEIMK